MQFYAQIWLCDAHKEEVQDAIPHYSGEHHYDVDPHLPRDQGHTCMFGLEGNEEGCCTKPAIKRCTMVVEPVLLRILAAARGGSAKSLAKREAARDNGAKGGRPRLCAGCGRKMTRDESRTNGLGDCCESRPDALDGVYDIHETKDDGGGFYAELTLKDKRGTQFSPTLKSRAQAEEWAKQNGGTRAMWSDLS
jgi:hypothetical protein